MKLVLVSGRSGSGKSVLLRMLEDLGYYCVDNLPLPMMGTLLKELSSNTQFVAISVDIRNLPEKESELTKHLTFLPDGVELLSFFLNSTDEVLLKRYNETRRLHPLSHDNVSLKEAIELEGRLLEPLANIVDHYIDTSSLNIYDLNDQVREILLGNLDKELMINFESFGFKHGMPIEADFMFDVRFLPNPHWEPDLRPMTGLDKPVQDFLNERPRVNLFIKQIEELLESCLPDLERNNRSYLTIAIGCTGGQHRSVYITERLAAHFKKTKHKVNARHRELTNANH
ncbi:MULTISPECIES: RNase adapter RapZ [unclassified Shewanella]|uniref:RNase adapter RapZ n=1 Tax=unclassified Shewanella TaxID=196818 RepID=UPI001BBB5F12|nr:MULTISPECIES: RNase adapter RapZ [unclassified Shewanella]GIU19348.1 nucleotide-binding protein [Shewanella sp. MBTL60-112-B1]GIU24974.1 nucleotide-binding protein [Shewanella sp. MBTL60-112-B2]